MPASLPPDVTAALDKGQLVEAIKRLRASGMQATDIKEAVDAYMRNAGDRFRRPGPTAPTAPPMAPPPAIASPADTTRSLSPGEVGRSGGIWQIVIVVALGFVAWWLLRRFA